MDKILERYERYSYAERQLTAPDSDSPGSWTLEYSKLKSKFELLQRNQRQYMGENLDSLSVKELQNLEQQIDTALKHIRSRKNQLMYESISELQKKEKAIQEQNNMLAKQIKEKEKEKNIVAQQMQWEHQNHGPPNGGQPPPYLLHHPQLPCLNMGGNYQGVEQDQVRRNELELTLEPIYSCHLGCFAT